MVTQIKVQRQVSRLSIFYIHAIIIYCFCFVSSIVSRGGGITLSCIKCESSTLIRETRQTARCLHDTLLHSGSTQLNYEWRSILREGNCHAGSLRGVPTREELRGFRGKIKRKKSSLAVACIIDMNDQETCPISSFHTLSNRSTLRNAIFLCNFLSSLALQS